METSLHIDHVDEAVMQALQQMAREEHVSVEEVARRELARLRTRVGKRGDTTAQPLDKNAVLHSQFGCWTQEDLEEFERNIAPLREVDPEMWK